MISFTEGRLVCATFVPISISDFVVCDVFVKTVTAVDFVVCDVFVKTVTAVDFVTFVFVVVAASFKS